ncbi:MAG: hypothetical protein H7Z12_03970 [Rhodospirillaceae bacterium]|nr:hypothetical protein [Rhodospirillales bacterium]
MRVAPPLFLVLAGLVSSCAAEPFVDTGMAVTVQKAPNTLLESGDIYICHSDSTPWDQVLGLAEEQCAAHGLKAVSSKTQRWQCRATSPHRSHFTCVDPDMRNTDGSYVNPFNSLEVGNWQKRTGKTAPAYRAARGTAVSPPAPATATPDIVPNPPGPAAPPRAPISAVPPALTPADIAGKPAMPAQPPRMDSPPPPPPPAPVDGGFKLPVGSWGDSFQE